jgi:hypothetical protein
MLVQPVRAGAGQVPEDDGQKKRPAGGLTGDQRHGRQQRATHKQEQETLTPDPHLKEGHQQTKHKDQRQGQDAQRATRVAMMTKVNPTGRAPLIPPDKSPRASHMCKTTCVNLAPGYAPVATEPSEWEDHLSHVYPMPNRTCTVSDQHHYVYALTQGITCKWLSYCDPSSQLST